MSETEQLIIFTDGGARGNPGPAGIGVVLYKSPDHGITTEKIGEIKKYIGSATNNFAEYSALIAGLERGAELGYAEAMCFLDSELVVRQLNGQYKVREESLKPLAQRVLALTNKFKSVSFTHVPREKNAEADKLVNLAIDEALAT
jgi:ribonuclease HI